MSNIVNFNNPSMRDVRIQVSNVDNVPQSGVIIEGRVVSRRNSDNKPIDGTIEKITLSCLPPEVVKAIQTINGDLNSIKPFTVELQNDESILKEIILGDLIGKTVNLQNAKIAFKWVQDSRGSGSYKEFKLVISSLEHLTIKVNRKIDANENN
ncbi:hypothetical protein SFB93_13435 [Kurthia gibsonii]|uniref:hypothetical protein n=1 Tax=Kurthia gibsonii TaxID=33946 RepID=UPI003983D63F